MKGSISGLRGILSGWQGAGLRAGTQDSGVTHVSPRLSTNKMISPAPDLASACPKLG